MLSESSSREVHQKPEWGGGPGPSGPGVGLPPTWLPEDREVGLPAGQLSVREHHDTVLGSLVETEHGFLFITD